MLKRYFLSTLTLLLAASVSAQVNSDDPALYNTGLTNPNAKPAPALNMVKTLTVTGAVTPCDSGAATIVGSGACDYVWSTDSLAANIVGTGDTLVTGMLYNDTTLYVSGVEPVGADSSLGLPNYSNTFSGNVRGYYFIAPKDFVITGLRVPTNANTGAQNIAVLKFDNDVPPPLFSGTTNAFQTLGYWTNYTATDTIPVCFAVDSGNVIGIYGNRADQNAYAPAPYNTTIAGLPTTLTRSGMQLPLSSNPMSNVFSEAGGSISLVEMYYTDSTQVVTPTPVNVIVPTASAPSNATAVACGGDSALVNGTYYTMDTVVTDNFFNMYGCDSVVTTTVDIAPSYSINNSLTLCQGDSVMIGGNYYSSSGVVFDSTMTTVGCDSINIYAIQVVAPPTVTMGSFSMDSICDVAAPFALPTGSPAGGTYSGPGVSGSNFDPSAAGTGTHTIMYTYTDTFNCSASASAMISVYSCIGINEQAREIFSIYPNPAEDFVMVQPLNNRLETVDLTDATGRTVASYGSVNGTLQIDLAGLASGMYFVNVRSNGQNYTQKIIKR